MGSLISAVLGLVILAWASRVARLRPPPQPPLPRYGTTPV
jgi:hypothetical protein